MSNQIRYAILANKESIIEAYKYGESTATIGAKHNVSADTIRNYLRAWGVEIRPNTTDLDANKRAIIDAYNQGAILIDLADQYNCSAGTIRTRLISWGVQLRPAHPS